MKLTIISIKQVEAQLYGYNLSPNRYNANPVLSRETEGIKLFINGTLEDGREVSFYTPTTVIVKTSGILNYKSIQSGGTNLKDNKNSWFKRLETKESKVHKNEYYYEGAKACNPPAYAEYFDEIVPIVKPGAVIDINFKVKKVYGSTSLLWYVKIVK